MTPKEFIAKHPWYKEDPKRFHRDEWYFYPEDKEEFDAGNDTLTDVSRRAWNRVEFKEDGFCCRDIQGHDRFDHEQRCIIDGKWQKYHEKGSNNFIPEVTT